MGGLDEGNRPASERTQRILGIKPAYQDVKCHVQMKATKPPQTHAEEADMKILYVGVDMAHAQFDAVVWTGRGARQVST